MTKEEKKEYNKLRVRKCREEKTLEEADEIRVKDAKRKASERKNLTEESAKKKNFVSG